MWRNSVCIAFKTWLFMYIYIPPHENCNCTKNRSSTIEIKCYYPCMGDNSCVSLYKHSQNPKSWIGQCFIPVAERVEQLQVGHRIAFHRIDIILLLKKTCSAVKTRAVACACLAFVFNNFKRVSAYRRLRVIFLPGWRHSKCLAKSPSILLHSKGWYMGMWTLVKLL